MASDLVPVEQPVKTPLGAIEKSALCNMIWTGDLSKLKPDEKVVHYVKLCERHRLDPFSNPFTYLVLNNKLVLYLNKGGAEQLRINNGVSIYDMKKEWSPDGKVFCVQVSARMGDRTDMATGSVALTDKQGDLLEGEWYSNALMKAETKAKRRVSLSICGLNMMDETEVETVPSARPVTVTKVGQETLQKVLAIEQKKPAVIKAHLTRLRKTEPAELTQEEADLVLHFAEEID